MLIRKADGNNTAVEDPVSLIEKPVPSREPLRPYRSSIPKGEWPKKRVWIDLDNSPHVPFFLPIIEQLKAQGVEILLTARNTYQVCELLEFFDLHCSVVGRHYGKHKLLKVAGNCLRVLQLAPLVLAHRPDLAISHGSRAQVLLCKPLGIPTVMMHDYEFTTKTGFIEPEWTLMPDVIPASVMSKKTERVLKYPGLKEDVYVPSFKPDASILRQLGISRQELVVTLRPPANEAHYHNPESDKLFSATLHFLADKPDVRVVTLPRSGKQSQQLRHDWPELIASGRMIIPDAAVNGLNLIWFSDLIISGGGTMNREAAALGAPVYSIFRGKIGAVDRYLADHGRLTLIENAQEIETKIKLIRWNRPSRPDCDNRPALQSIVRTITGILQAGYPVTSMQSEAVTH